MLSYSDIKKIEAVHGTPFYLFNEGAFVRNYDEIVAAFASRYDKFILAYSYKTNYVPYLCGIIRKKSGFAEVVSRLEYDLAIKSGQEPAKIIFNGPVKQAEDISLALENGSIVNLDSWYEVEHVTQYAKKHPERIVKTGLRINIGLSDSSGVSHIQEHLKVGRFGFSPEPAEIKKVISALTGNRNVIINSFHGHTSTTDRSLWCYRKITETLCGIASDYLPDTVEYINIGGGIYGHIPPQMRWAETPSFDEYAEAVTETLKKYSWVTKQRPYLVLEPGVAMVANAFSFVTKVISTKKIQEKTIVTVDGSAFNVKPTFHKINQPYEIITRNETKETQQYSVAGSTCMEKDYLLMDITAAKVQSGDYIRIDNVGAYTIVLVPPFINPAPPILVRSGSSYKVIREKQSLDDMFRNYTFE